MPDAASLQGQRITGWVRNFKETWGFLNSDSFDGDLFVGLRGNPHLSRLAQGDQVEFEVQVDPSGKAQAVSVITTIQGVNSTGAVRYNGWVRSFRGDWGFINSDAIPGDIFVGLKSNRSIAMLREGDQVSFETKTEGSKTEAINVMLARHTVPTSATFSGSLPPPVPALVSPGPAERAKVGHLAGHELAGRIKNFKDNWGFVVSDSFDGDLFIHSKNNPQLGRVGPGDPIKFEVMEDAQSAGNFCAGNALLLKEELANLVGQHIRGFVKSFRGGWGFINSARFEGDLFVGLKTNRHLEMTPLLQQGENVEFEVVADQKAGYQAINVKRLEATTMIMPTAMQMPSMAMLSSPMPAHVSVQRPGMGLHRAVKRPEELLGQRAHGTVRSFRGDWGFVVSDSFEGDLFLHQGSNPGVVLTTGTSIMFDISLGSGGKAHATAVQVAPPGPDGLVGRRCRGQVRSFKDTWGFVVSAEFYGDLFFGSRSNPELVTRTPREGDQVEFTVAVQQSANSPKPQYEAVQVMFVKNGAQGMSQSGRDHSRTPRPTAGRFGDAQNFVGQRLEGWIRSFKGEWGFVNSAAFTGDIFVGAKNNPSLAQAQVEPNQKVSFEVAQGSNGKFEARDVELIF